MQNVRCAHCGLLNFASAGECKRCRTPLAEAFVPEDGGGARCGFCGNETDAQYCPRCKAQVAQPAPSFDARGPSPRGGHSGARALRWLAVLAVLAAAGLAAYSYRHRIWYGAHADYALAIREAEQFNEPLSIKAKKRVTLGQGLDGPSHGGRDRSDPVYVLKARGSSSSARPGRTSASWAATRRRRRGPPASSATTTRPRRSP